MNLLYAAMTYRLIIALRQYYKRREIVTKKAQAENDMTKTLVVVVLMFMSCQLLNPIRRILYAVLPPSVRACGSPYFYFTYLTSLVLAIDVSSHFFIYSVCNKRFKEKLLQKWRRIASMASVSPAVGPEAGPAVVNLTPKPQPRAHEAAEIAQPVVMPI